MQEKQKYEQSGISGVTRRPCQLMAPTGLSEGQACRYGLTVPFQISPTEAGLFANIRYPGARIVDWEYGNDVIVFDNLDSVDSGRVFPLNRTREDRHPETGKTVLMHRGPFIGGFVPLGAKLANGTPHPHAGTGFAIAYSNAYPAVKDLTQPFSALQGEDAWEYHELCQFSYNGTDIFITDTHRLLPGQELLPGRSPSGSLRTAIPDGEDLIAGSNGGLVRWRAGKEGWCPASFTDITGGIPGSEDSLIRDVGGSLLYSFRPSRSDSVDTSTFQAILVWRSEDNGESWEKIIDIKNLRNGGPLTLNSAADGTPYVAANLTFQAFIRKDGAIDDCVRSSGYREVIMLWPLKEDRSGVLSPFVVRWPRYEFGPPPGGGSWAADHPTGEVVRLADGQWHSVLCYRVLEWGENGLCYPPTPWSGAYAEEVISSGDPKPVWEF